MKLKYPFLFFLLLISKTFSQGVNTEYKDVLFFINNAPHYTQEFIEVYQKNSKIAPENQVSVDDYLKLFVDFKLKVKEAKDLGLDTLTKFKKELNQYKNRLAQPYLKDEEITLKLVNEAYERLQKEVKVSHILVFVKPEATPTDTLEAFNKINKARELIINGSNFNEVALKYSEDPTVNLNKGELGYFTALQMVYPFENMAYTTSVNSISPPFKTKFGYHILKVDAVRKSQGEIEVAHIMLKGHGEFVEKRIDSIYKVLKTENEDFFELANKVSEDRATAVNGGKLKKFGFGQMVEDFAKVAFSLNNEGELSKPFKTQYGWHIVKLIKKYPIESFENLKAELTQKVERDSRSNLISETLIKKLLKEYTVKVNNEALNQFFIDNWKSNPEKFKLNLVSINNTQITQKQFIEFLKKSRSTSINSAFKTFKEKEILNYYKENLLSTNIEFAKTFSEFKEGLLLFELLENEVWEKSKNKNDVLEYFEANKEKYQKQEFDSIKGKVISDFQNYLEQQLVEKLHKKYTVKFNEKERKRILKLKI